MRDINRKIKATLAGFMFFVSSFVPVIALMPSASAATLTWDGEGADNNWSTAANWSGDTVPVDGDIVVFDVSNLTQDETVNNDLTNLSLAGITRTGTSDIFNQLDYTVEGNGIELSGPFVGGALGEYGSLILNIDVSLAADLNVASMRLIDIGLAGSLNLGAYDLTVAGGFAAISNISGSGDINVISDGSLSIGGTASAFTSSINASSGTVIVSNESVSGATSITVSGSAGLVITGQNNFTVPLIVGGSGSPCFGPGTCNITAINGISITGGLTLTSNIGFATDGVITIQNPFTANSYSVGVTQASLGSVVLPDGRTIEAEEDTITISSGDSDSSTLSAWNRQTVILNGQRGSAYIYNGGILRGNGTVTGLVNIAAGGTLAPGESPGCITFGGLAIAGTYEVEIAGATACSGYDRTTVNGSVILTGSTLEVSFLNGFTPTLNSRYVIIENDGSDSVVDTFTGLANGSEITVGGVRFRINYDGGDGNDVVLTVISVPAGISTIPASASPASSSGTPTAPDTGVVSVLSSPVMSLISMGIIGVLVLAMRVINV